jgi:DNA-binding NarL/FixJ family response regulator
LELAAVLVADRDKAFRVAVSALVTHAGMTARTAATGVEALASARSDHPSVVVLDVGLREISGYATCRGLREMFGEALPILFVSSERTEPSDRVAGLLLGADDYLAKPIDSDELLARIRRSATRSVAHARGAHADGAGGLNGWEKQRQAVVRSLTAREIEVLRLIAVGQTPREISEQLVISPKTVASHLQRILTKLAVHSRAQAVVLAYQLGLVTATAEGTTSILG